MSKIETLRNNLISMIEENEDLALILFNFKQYLLEVMERDIPHINVNTREQLANYIIDYVKEGIKKEYFDTNNIKKVMIKLIDSCKKFYEITSGIKYGECGSGLAIGFNFRSNFAISNMKEIIFHELTHAVAPLFKQNLGFLRLKIEKTGNLINGFSTKNKPKNHVSIIDNAMIDFLREIIAEATACDLAEAYKPTKEEVCYGITSDWVAIYNKAYQQVGYEFLKTLTNDSNADERKLFKELTIKAINAEDNDKDKDIGSQIIQIYQTKNPDSWKEDLHEITTVLGELVTKHNLSANIEKVNEVRELMKKYMPKEQVISIVVPEIRQEGFRVTSRPETEPKVEGFRVISRLEIESRRKR